MANFVAIVDPDPQRRAGLLQAAAAQLPPLAGLSHGRLAAGDFAAAWVCGEHAPISRQATDDGAAILFGDAIDHLGRRASAAELVSLWNSQDPPAHDGYFAGVAYDRSGGLSVGGDVLGLFPLYYLTDGEIAICASSCAAFSGHPRFAAGVSPLGLAGILMTAGLVGERPLLEGIHRLAPGRLLRIAPGSTPCERTIYRPRRIDLPADPQQQDELARLTFHHAAGRHDSGVDRSAILLSGGLDSRLTAAVLVDQGATPHALCLGREGDFEVLAAREVARRLELPLTVCECEPVGEEFTRLARRSMRLEHLSASLSFVDFWSAGEELGKLAPRFWSGQFFDDIFGGKAFYWARDASRGVWTIEGYLHHCFNWGTTPAGADRLLAPCGEAGLGEAVFDSLRQDCYQADEPPWISAFRGKLQRRVRHHLGIILWRLSFSSWPLLPAVDRTMLDLAVSLPPEVVADRGLQRRWLADDYPQLADVPLDANSYRFEAVKRGRLGNIIRRIDKALPARRLRRRLRWGKDERRRYYRLFDLDGPHWTAVRRRAGSPLVKLGDMLDLQAVRQLLPDPSHPLPAKDPFREGGLRRTLLGLGLWAEEHLA